MAARQSRRGSSDGGGIILAVVTVLIILGLIGGYIPVVLTLDPYRKATEELNALIETNVYEPLMEAGAEVQVAPITADRRTPYDLNLMRVAKQYIEWGGNLDNVTQVIGWESETAVADIRSVLEDARDVDLRPSTIRQYVQELRLALRTSQTEVSSLESDLERARTEAGDLREQLDNAKLEVRRVEERAQRDIIAEREKKEGEIETLSRTNDRLAENLETSRNEARRLTQTLSQDRDRWEDRRGDLEAEIARLERRLAERLPVVIEPREGEVQSADMIREYAIVNLGKQDGMALGDEVNIYRVGRGAIRILKAVGRVVSTQEFVSRVDLMDIVDPDYPVIEGDIVVPAAMEEG